MSAREKLNGAHLLGALLVASVLGGITESVVVFAVALAIIVWIALRRGDIRPSRQ